MLDAVLAVLPRPEHQDMDRARLHDGYVESSPFPSYTHCPAGLRALILGWFLKIMQLLWRALDIRLGA